MKKRRKQKLRRIRFLLGISCIFTMALGIFLFMNTSQETELETEKVLDSGLVLEIDPETGDILDLEITKEFLVQAFNLDENQVNLQVLEAIRDEIGYGSETYLNFMETGLIEAIEPKIETQAVSSDYILLVDAQNGRVLLDVNGSQRMYPASMTKVMTALVAIEKLEDLDQMIYLDGDMFNELYIQGASMAGFAPHQSVSALELLYGILLPSGGESTLAIARAVAGTEMEFVQLMNEKANEIGLQQTHFMNPTGLHHPDHYSTAEDMVKILKYALHNETFKDIFTTTQMTTSAGLPLRSTLFNFIPRTEVTHGEIIGGRTGFTPEAGRCLISLATINGRDYILVTAGAENSQENRIQHFLDTLYILDQL